MFLSRIVIAGITLVIIGVAIKSFFDMSATFTADCHYLAGNIFYMSSFNDPENCKILNYGQLSGWFVILIGLGVSIFGISKIKKSKPTN